MDFVLPYDITIDKLALMSLMYVDVKPKMKYREICTVMNITNSLRPQQNWKNFVLKIA